MTNIQVNYGKSSLTTSDLSDREILALISHEAYSLGRLATDSGTLEDAPNLEIAIKARRIAELAGALE